jgi:hypothetical protein
MKTVHEPWSLADYLEKQPKRGNMDIRFGTLNVRCLYMTASLMSVLKELSNRS